MITEWERKGNVLAERFKKNEIPGFLKKEFRAKEDEFVVFEKNNEIYRERGPGKYSFRAGDMTGLLLIDKSEKTVDCGTKNVWLADDKRIDINCVIRFRIFHSHHFSRYFMKNRRRFSARDLRNEMLSKIAYKMILPELERKTSKDFTGEDSVEKVKGEIESCVKNFFKNCGIILSSLSIDFKFPDKEDGQDK